MDLAQALTEAKDAITVRRVYGEPYEAGDGLVVIPAAVVQGGGGGGEGRDGAEGQGSGGGFGMRAHPVGAYVVKDGEVTWVPALDLNKVIFWGQVTAIVALLALRAILRRRR